MSRMLMAIVALALPATGQSALAQPPPIVVKPVTPYSGPPPPPVVVPSAPRPSSTIVRYSRDPNDNQMAVLRCKLGEDRTFSDCVVNESNPASFASLAMYRLSQQSPAPPALPLTPGPDGLYRVVVAGGGIYDKLRSPLQGAAIPPPPPIVVRPALPPPVPPKRDTEFGKGGACVYGHLTETERQALVEAYRRQGRIGYINEAKVLDARFVSLTNQCDAQSSRHALESAELTIYYVDHQSGLRVLRDQGLSEDHLDAAWKSAPAAVHTALRTYVAAMYHRMPLPVRPDLTVVFGELAIPGFDPKGVEADIVFGYYISAEMIDQVTDAVTTVTA